MSTLLLGIAILAAVASADPRPEISPTESIFVSVPLHGGTRTVVVPEGTTTGYFKVEDLEGEHLISIAVINHTLIASSEGQTWQGKIFACYRDPYSPAYVSWDNEMDSVSTKRVQDVCAAIGNLDFVTPIVPAQH